MSVAQGGSDFASDFVQRQSDDCALSVGVVGSTIWGIVSSSWVRRYLFVWH